ncbi:MAG: ribosomal protein S18-alanine N-acetyltransferase [Candidatus Eisenbacteria bacterium]
MYEILPLTPADLDDVSELEARCFSDPWPRELFLREAEDRSDNFCRVVRDLEGELLAYSIAWIIADEAHLGDIAVAPEQRGKGLAKLLLRELIDEARIRGAVHIVLEVRASNDGAITLYESHGFTKVAIRKGYYQDDAEDALVMMLHLQPEVQPDRGTQSYAGRKS